jgi:hypothetical protein
VHAGVGEQVRHDLMQTHRISGDDDRFFGGIQLPFVS